MRRFSLQQLTPSPHSNLRVLPVMSYQIPLTAILPATAAAVLICLSACKRDEPAEMATPPVESPAEPGTGAGSGTLTPGTTTTPAETPVDAGVAPAAPQYNANEDANAPASSGTAP